MILCRDSLPCKKAWLTDFVYLENARSIFAQHLHLFSSSTAVRELQRQEDIYTEVSLVYIPDQSGLHGESPVSKDSNCNNRKLSGTDSMN